MKKILLGVLFFVGIFTFLSTNTFAQTCYTFRYGMALGSTDTNSGQEVSRLQAILNSGGFLAVSPTGYYGILTKEAVSRFQANQGIDPIGIVGPMTRVALSNCNSGSSYQPPTYSGTNTGSTIPVTFNSLDEKVTLSVPYGSILNLPNLSPRLKYIYYNFLGWFMDQGYNTKYASTPITVSTSLFAKWIRACNNGSIAVFPTECPTTATSSPTAPTSTPIVNNAELKQCTYGGFNVTVPINFDCNTLGLLDTSTTTPTSTNPITSQPISGNSSDNPNYCSLGLQEAVLYPNSVISGMFSYIKNCTCPPGSTKNWTRDPNTKYNGYDQYAFECKAQKPQVSLTILKPDFNTNSYTPDIRTYTYGQDMQNLQILPTAGDSGYSFIGLFKDQNFSTPYKYYPETELRSNVYSSTSFKPIYEDATVYAKFAKVCKDNTIVVFPNKCNEVDDDGPHEYIGFSTPFGNIKVVRNISEYVPVLNIPNIEAFFGSNGYKFEGWYEDFTFKNPYTSSKPISLIDSKQIYSKWTKVCPNGQKVVYPLDCWKPFAERADGKVKITQYSSSPRVTSVYKGSNVILGVPWYLNEIYDFAGWFKDSAYTLPTSGSFWTSSEEDYVLYAKYEQICTDGTKVVYPSSCEAVGKVQKSAAIKLDPNTGGSMKIGYKYEINLPLNNTRVDLVTNDGRMCSGSNTNYCSVIVSSVDQGRTYYNFVAPNVSVGAYKFEFQSSDGSKSWSAKFDLTN